MKKKDKIIKTLITLIIISISSAMPVGAVGPLKPVIADSQVDLISLFQQDDAGNTIIHKSVETNNIEVVMEVLSKLNEKQKEQLLCMKNAQGYTPLTLALSKGYLELSMLLKQNGALISSNNNALCIEESSFDKDEFSIDDEFIFCPPSSKVAPKDEQDISSFRMELNEALSGELFDSNYVSGICKQVMPILKDEPTMLKLNGPAIIVGDIHGNLESLSFCINKFLEQVHSGKSIIFLGDYVDRGKNSIECITLLFKLKTMFPKNVFLLRGNHEFTDMNSINGFSEEIFDKYFKNKFGNLVFRSFYNNIAEVFKHLPIAATVNDSLFCVHAGISKEIQQISDIESEPKPGNETKRLKGNNIMTNLLWSDPCTDDELKRTDMKAIIKWMSRPPFSHDNAKEFLKRVNLKHIVRGHECVNEGCQDRFGDKSVITVFSSSDYCNFGNKAAIMEYNSEDDYKIIQFDNEKAYEPIQLGGVNKE